jgi:hypothetical protein
MAVLAGKSTQETNRAAGKKMSADQEWGNELSADVDYVHGAAAGDIGSTIDLLFIPPGRYWLMLQKSLMERTALGAARTMAFGYRAYTDDQGVAVAESAAAFDAALDYSAAGSSALGADIAAKSAKKKLFATSTGVVIFCTVAGGTIPAAAELHGYLALRKA